MLHLGVGDVRGPLIPAVIAAMQKAVEEQGREETFRGYGPEQGYWFLREAMAREDFQARGAQISPEEICISDGAKSDCGNIGDLFAFECRIAVCDPVYPAYVDAAAIMGRAGDFDPVSGRWSGLCYLPCGPENGFVPRPPEEPVDLVWLCLPNNPTGAAATREQLREWVEYANACGAVLLFDAAYEAYISDPSLPHSIFEIEGAKRCAIEFRSFSKTAGFTGVRCAAAVIPETLTWEGQSLLALWKRRQSARYNGTAYIVQRGAAAIYSEEGRVQVRENIRRCQENARKIRDCLAGAGLLVYGGLHSPYVWVKTPGDLRSWDFFELLLCRANVVSTPGSGFGPGGEGYLRLSALGAPEEVEKALERFRKIL